MFLGLRKIQGVSKKCFEELFKVSMEEVYGEVISAMIDKGLLEEADEYVKLTEAGIDVSNYVMADYLM
jgi:oxygen-independent coproporphyrinogen-3 oxidase